VTVDKNMFGYLLFAFGLYFAAALTSGWQSRSHERDHKRTDQIVNVLLLAMTAWLIPIANSKTSTVALTAGIAIIVALQLPTVRRHFLPVALAAVLVVTVGDSLFSVKSSIIEASGRDATFTGRTGLWETVLNEPINPLVGAGYASFWLGERLARFWVMYPTSPPIQAHNGYIEVYLNLGILGVCLLAGVLWRGLRTVQTRATASLALSAPSSRNEHTLAIFGLAYAVAYLLYNVTEATFQGLNFLFLIFLMLAFRSSAKQSTSSDSLVAGATKWGERPSAAGRMGGAQ
jgi:O-antigen ligase